MHELNHPTSPPKRALSSSLTCIRETLVSPQKRSTLVDLITERACKAELEGE